MPIHDWTRVDAGIYHHFHHGWIEDIARKLNRGVLPEAYYALAEQFAGGFGPDVLTLQSLEDGSSPSQRPSRGGAPQLQLAPPTIQVTSQSEMAFYRRKQTSVAIRHVSDDRVVAIVEVVSPGNKASRHAFVEKAAQLLDKRIHLLILDLLPPTRRDPHGIHDVIWQELENQEFVPPPAKPLTLVAYEADLIVKAYVQPVAVGDALEEMPLFLEPGAHVLVPLEETYQSAFAAVPQRWRRVLESKPTS